MQGNYEFVQTATWGRKNQYFNSSRRKTRIELRIHAMNHSGLPLKQGNWDANSATVAP